jgi:hypothetical protein
MLALVASATKNLHVDEVTIWGGYADMPQSAARVNKHGELP